jgi:hypothetical protein
LKCRGDFLEGHCVIRALLTFLRFLRIPTFIIGRGADRRGPVTPVRSGQFASFMSVQGCSRRRNPDRHDRRLQVAKFTRTVTKLAALGGFAWIALESAKALSVF